MRELLVDRLARRLGLDPAELRRRNMLRPEDLPWKNVGGATYDSGDYRGASTWRRQRIGYDAFRARQQALRARDATSGSASRPSWS